MCGLGALCVCKDSRNNVQIVHAFSIVLFFPSAHSNLVHPGQAMKTLFSVFGRQNTSGPIGKMRNKEFETLYPVSTALCVSQRPGPIIHSSFPYLPTFLYLEWKTNKNPKAAGSLGASVWKRCLSLDPLFIPCPQVSSLDHTYLSASMLLFLLSFFLFSPFLYLYKNKALLMTMGSQGPAGARVLESVAQWKGGHLLLLFLLFYHRWE